jgi:hypothetical protein
MENGIHPTLKALYGVAITAAADLWSGAEVADMLNSEYLKGQVELIVNLCGLGSTGDDPRDAVELDIIREVCGIA